MELWTQSFNSKTMLKKIDICRIQESVLHVTFALGSFTNVILKSVQTLSAFKFQIILKKLEIHTSMNTLVVGL
jgi:hypothetical protein